MIGIPQTVRLSETEKELLGGARGAIVAEALRGQIEVGDFFGAERFVPVGNVHMMGDIEVMGEGGLEFLRRVAWSGARCAVNTTTNARCFDFEYAGRLGQDPENVARERDLISCFREIGVITTDTCINYQAVPYGQDRGALSARDGISVYRATGSFVEGEALISVEGFSPRYDLDRMTGEISRPGHDIAGENIAGKVLFFPSAKGGIAAGWAFFDLASKDIAPKAIVFGKINPVMVQGAVFAGITITEGWSENPTEVFRTGDTVRVDPFRKSVEFLKRA